MLEGPANGDGLEGSIAIKNLFYEAKTGGFNYLSNTIDTIQQNDAQNATDISNIVGVLVIDTKNILTSKSQLKAIFV